MNLPRPSVIKTAQLEPWQQELVVENRRIVFSVGRSLVKNGPLPDDMRAEGELGLCMAAQRFDRNRNLKFITYAVHWVRARMFQWLLDNRGPVRLGTTKDNRKAFFGIGKARAALGEDATYEAIAAKLGVDVDTVERMHVRFTAADVALDAVDHENRQRMQLADERPTAEEGLASIEGAAYDQRVIKNALRCLGDRDRTLIRLRYLRQDPWTLQQIGVKFGLSRERVRQLEFKALRKLRIVIARKRLES